MTRRAIFLLRSRKTNRSFEELAAGIDRPKAQWTPDWKTRELPRVLSSIYSPQYSTQTGWDCTLELRGIAAVRTGDAAKAYDSALIIARLSEADLNDSSLLGLLVGASGASILCDVTWEFCDAHTGTAEDFARLEGALAKLDFHRATLRGLRSELAVDINRIQYLKDAPTYAVSILGLSGSNGAPNGRANSSWAKPSRQASLIRTVLCRQTGNFIT